MAGRPAKHRRIIGAAQPYVLHPNQGDSCRGPAYPAHDVVVEVLVRKEGNHEPSQPT